MKAKLNFINHSSDTNNSSIVIFQKSGNHDLIAWIVIKDSSQECFYPFEYDNELQNDSSDDLGDTVPNYPAIYIGALSTIREGDIMNAARINGLITELPLLGIVSADIVMTGGGPGQSSTPYIFTLENAVFESQDNR